MQPDPALERQVLSMIKHWPGVPALVTFHEDGSWSVTTPELPSDEYIEALSASRRR